MDKEYEEAFVKNFFSKNLRDRVLFELFSPKKRRDALWRLNHNYNVALNEKYIVSITQRIANTDELLQLLKNHGAKDSCYVMSLNENVDGKHLPLHIAVEKIAFYGLSSIISCVPDKLAYFQAEQDYGSRERYLLKRN
ncbi:hypothetical protein CN544_29125 [Bacillus toyonensis]|uniref:hypothetical protein n=1 Tax=Bacillus toyonensis TaxID=155322 RepID=UPI000BEDAC7A|nr:hypothetical protein [Bacillus toyonensis]MCU5397604.1 hypothetical protein [Bacillus toyonensis]PED97580.1 hypothetical protein CON78_26330 [Bacillus toyonensis]PEN68857.1 hypothetical protein CN539_27950 [Bacillus toyonensis]PEN76645.1 hypothetical protein CN544_29125 [Bacillus toyonensis]QWH48340.1 hypothetical protein EXW64_29020 [Bacillus toyonensis]